MKYKAIPPIAPIIAYMIYKTGAINRNVNSSGSVTFPKNAVITLVRIKPFANALFSL